VKPACPQAYFEIPGNERSGSTSSYWQTLTMV